MILSAQAADQEEVDSRGDGYFWLLTIVLVGAVLFAFLAPAQPGSPNAALALAFGERIEATHAVPTVLGHETFSASGAATAGLGWLGALATALAYDLGGWRAVGLFAALATLAALMLTELRARKRSDELTAMTVTLLASLTMLDALRPGLGAATWFLCALFLSALELPGNGVLCAIPIAILWCNVAPSGLLAPALALLYALGRTLAAGAAAPAKTAWVAFAGCVLATFVTPGGLAYPPLAAGALHLWDGPLQTAPFLVAPIAYRAGGATILALVTLLGLRGARAHDLLFFVGATVLALLDGRFLPLFGIVAAPLAAEAAARAKLFPANVVRAASLALGTVLAAGVVWNVRVPPSTSFSPAQLVATVEASGSAPRLYCGRLEWCDYVAAAHGRSAVYMDGRVEAYPPHVVATQLAIAQLKPHWRKSLAAAAIDTVVVERRSALAALLSRSPGWTAAGATGDLRVFKREAAGS